MAILASRSVHEAIDAAAWVGVDLTARTAELASRLVEDEATLDLLRSFDPDGTPPPGHGLGGDRVEPLRWAPQDARTGDPGPARPARAPRRGPTWLAVFDDVPQRPGPLEGVDVGVKDLLAVAGHAMTAGTPAFAAPPSAEDAPAVAALRRAGARIVGTTNLDALAYAATGSASGWGMPQNPAVAGGLTGGSSSGSAVAVADGSADLALGTDTAGSIRIPASLCGVVGFKPTYDRVSRAGAHPLGPSLDHVGPLARTVQGVEAAFAALIGGDPTTGSYQPLGGPVVVGVLGGYFATMLSPLVRSARAAALDLLERAGLHLREVELPLTDHIPGAQLATLSTEALTSNLTTLRERGHLLSEGVRVRLEAGFGRTPEQYDLAQRFRERWKVEVDAALRSCHVLLAPTTSITAPPVGTTHVTLDGTAVPTQFALSRLTMPFNQSGHPALTVPWSAPDGTPVGLQLVGRRGEDRDLLRVGGLVEGLLRA